MSTKTIVSHPRNDFKYNAVPYKSFDSIFESFDKIFETAFRDSFPEFEKSFGFSSITNQAYPKVDIIDYPEKVVIKSEIHGIDKKDIKVTLEKGYLTISGNKQDSVKSDEKDDGKYIRREIKKSSFSRSFTLDDRFDESSIKADHKDGILSITVKKKVILEDPVKVINIE